MTNPETGNADDRKPETQATPFVLPLPIRLLNRIGARLERVGAFRNLLSVDSIMKQAKKASDHLSNLGVLLSTFPDAASSTCIGTPRRSFLLSPTSRS